MKFEINSIDISAVFTGFAYLCGIASAKQICKTVYKIVSQVGRFKSWSASPKCLMLSLLGQMSSYFILSPPCLLLAWVGKGAGSSGGRKGSVRELFMALRDTGHFYGQFPTQVGRDKRWAGVLDEMFHW